MEKRIGASAGPLAIIVIILHSLGSIGGEEKNPKPPVKTDTAAETKAAADKAELSNEQGPWRATQQYFHSDSAGRVTPITCRNYLLGLEDRCSQRELLSLFGFEPDFDLFNLEYLVVTLADPLHTRMALDTDRDLEAIQRAASMSKWELATQWLPWTAKQADPNSPEAATLERYPGLLIFRQHFSPGSNSNKLLLVLVVAEMPTAGINRSQFEVVRRLVSRTGSADPDKIRIAAPKFSGSFQSLTRLLVNWPGIDEFLVQSGSVSNSDSARQMLLEFKAKAEKNQSHSTLTFRGSTLPTKAFEDQFKRLVEKLGLSVKLAADINEGGTGFSARSSPGSIPVYSYSRDVAQVRNSYSDAAFINPGAQKNPALTSPLEFSFKDSQFGEDSFPMFSKSHTPVSKNAELVEMIRSLKQTGVRIASLSATNVFDTLFLANVLRRNCPDLRIVVRSPDLLFSQEASRSSLSGLLAISSFPPPELNEWSRLNKTDVEIFASDDQKGEFLAIAALLQQGGWPDKNALPISPAWLLELGSSGWHAIDLLQQANPWMQTDENRADWFDSRLLRTVVDLPPLGRARLRWVLLCLTIASVTLALCGRLLYLKLSPGLLVWSHLCLSDLDGPERKTAVNQTVHHRYLCMISCYAVLAFLNGLLLCPMAAAHFRYGGSINLAVEGIVLIAFAGALITVVYLIVIVPARVCASGPWETCSAGTPIAWESYVIKGLVVLLLFDMTKLWWRCCDADVSGYLLCFRSFNLSAPVSPILPLLTSGIGLFALAYFQLRRFTWGDRRQPRLDTGVLDKALCNEFRDYKGSLARCLYCPRIPPEFRCTPFSLIISATAITAMLLLVWSFTPRLLEPSEFLWLSICLQIPLAVFSGNAFLRFLQSWRLLKGFLSSMNSVALGRYMERLPEFAGSGPVWMREVKVRSLTSFINSSIALHNLDRTQCLNERYAEEFFESLQKFLNPAHRGKATRVTFIGTYQAFRQTAAKISKQLGELVLMPYWASHRLSYVASSDTEPAATSPEAGAAAQAFSAAAGASSGSPDRLRDAAAQLSERKQITPEAYRHASKYVALQYSIFIGYVLQHLQNLLLCSIAGFVLIVIALNCFAFQFPEALSCVIAAVLVLSAIAVVTVLAQLERDPIVSRLSGTHEWELGKDFYIRVIAYGALPVLTVISTQFPAVSRFLTSWVEPAVSKLQ